MPSFCDQCGAELGTEAKYCAECGEQVWGFATSATGRPGDQRATQPSSTSGLPQPKPEPEAQPPATTSSQQDTADLTLRQKLSVAMDEGLTPVECPGCKTTTGSPSDICPSCGSRYPNPLVGLLGAGLFLLGFLLLMLALVIYGGLFESNQTNGLESIGAITLIVGVALVFYSNGRSGPKQATSCCGCSCVVVILVLPSLAAGLWTTGGPVLAAGAVPLSIPAIIVMDEVASLGWFMARSARVTLDHFTA